MPNFPIPNDPAEVRRIIMGLSLERDDALRERDHERHEREQAQRERDEQRLEAERLKARAEQLELEKQTLEFELARANRRLYGPRADQIDTDQLLLEFGQSLESRPLDMETIAEAAAAQEATKAATAGKPTRRVKSGRRNLAAFDKLPVKRKIHDLLESEKPCPGCGKIRCRICNDSLSLKTFLGITIDHKAPDQASGFGTPQEVLERRFSAGGGHHRGIPVETATIDSVTTHRLANRGREQLVYESLKARGLATEQNNPVSDRNPNAKRYRNAAIKEFGPSP